MAQNILFPSSNYSPEYKSQPNQTQSFIAMEKSKRSDAKRAGAHGRWPVLCLVMRLYPTFSLPGLLSTFARHVLNNAPFAACLSLTWFWDMWCLQREEDDDFEFAESTSWGYRKAFFCLSVVPQSWSSLGFSSYQFRKISFSVVAGGRLTWIVSHCS